MLVSFKRVVGTPLSDPRMITAQEHFWHLHTLKLFRTSILRELKHFTIAKTLDYSTRLTAKYARNKSYDTINNRHSGQFTPRQHIVADTHLFIYKRDDTLVVPLVAATYEYIPFATISPLLSKRLLPALTARSH